MPCGPGLPEGFGVQGIPRAFKPVRERGVASWHGRLAQVCKATEEEVGPGHNFWGALERVQDSGSGGI